MSRLNKTSLRRFCLHTLCIVILGGACAHAEDFSWQFVATAQDAEVARTAKADGATLSATYYFRPVDDSGGPYALAPFLTRSSRVSATYSEDKTTAIVRRIWLGPLPPPVDSPPASVSVTRAAGRSLSGRHVWRDSGWYVGAALAQADAAHPAPLSSAFSLLGDDLTTRSLTLGKYVARSTAVELAAVSADTTLTSELPLFCRAGACSLRPIAQLRSTYETTLDSVELSARHIGRFGRFTYSLSGGVTASESDFSGEVVETPLEPVPPLFPISQSIIEPGPSGAIVHVTSGASRAQRYALGGELYPTPALGVYVDYVRWDGDDSRDARYDVGATWFFRRRVGVQLGWSKTDSHLPIVTVTNVEAVTLQLIGRL